MESYSTMVTRLMSMRGNDNGWKQRHCQAWFASSSANGMETAIVALVKALTKTAEQYERANDRPIGECGFGAEYFEDLCRSVLAMLNYDCGRLDCGTVDRTIRAIATRAGIGEL